VQTLKALAKPLQVLAADTVEGAARASARRSLLHGTSEDVKLSSMTACANTKPSPFEGVVPTSIAAIRESDSAWRARGIIGRYIRSAMPRFLHGLTPEARSLSVKIDGKHIGERCDLSISGAVEWFEALPKKLTKKQNEIAQRILKEIT
jgi:excinuclease ABC subunit A